MKNGSRLAYVKASPPAVARNQIVFSSPLEEPNSGKGRIAILNPDLRRIVQLIAVDRVDVATEFLAHVLADRKLSSIAEENPLRSESIIDLSHEYINWLKQKTQECKSTVPDLAHSICIRSLTFP